MIKPWHERINELKSESRDFPDADIIIKKLDEVLSKLDSIERKL